MCAILFDFKKKEQQIKIQTTNQTNQLNQKHKTCTKNQTTTLKNMKNNKTISLNHTKIINNNFLYLFSLSQKKTKIKKAKTNHKTN